MARRKQNRKNRSRRANKNSRDGMKKDYGVPNTSGVFIQPRPMDGITGYPPMEKPKKENKLTQLPPGRGKRFIEHISTFQTRLQSYWSKIYINSDEAYQQSRDNASAMRHDPVIMHPLRQRQLATALLEGHVLPENANDPIQKAVAEELQVLLNRTPYFMKLKLVWLEALWFGKYGTNMVYNWDVQHRTGEDGIRKLDTVMQLRDWVPVHGDKIRHEHESGRIGIMTSRVGWLDQGLDRYQGGIRVSDESRVQMVPLSDAWRQAFVVHKHEIEDGNFYDGRSAGMIHGVGLRTRVYWPWWFKQKLLQWVMEFAERFALGIQLWYYEAGNPESEKEVRTAAEEFSNENIIIFPRPIGEEKQGAGYERIEPGMGGTQFFKDLLDDYFGKQIKLMIIGQELTSDTASTGLGSGVAKEHRNTFQQIVRFDSQNLAETITNEYLRVLAEYNYPGISWTPRYEFVLEEIDPKRVMESIQMYLEMGGAVSDDEVRSVAGLKKPEKGEKTLGQVPSTFNSNGQIPNQAPPPQPLEQIQEQIPRNGQNAAGSRDGMPSGDGQPLQGGRFGVQQSVSFSKIWEHNGHADPVLNQEVRSQLLDSAYDRAESLGIHRHRIVDIVLVPSIGEEVEVVVIVDPGKENPGKYQKWITIGGHEEGGKKHVEGMPIQIDESGNVKKGPSSLVEKNLGTIDRDVAGTEQDERKEAEPTKKKKVFGKSKAKLSSLGEGENKNYLEKINKVFEKKMTEENLASIVGATDFAKIDIGYVTGEDIGVMQHVSATIYVTGKTINPVTGESEFAYRAYREIYQDDKGNLHISNESFFVEDEYQGKGIGLEVFGRQVENAREFGIDHINVLAGKSREMNGYYTWARFGYDANLDDMDNLSVDNLVDIEARFGDVKTLQELMQKPGGSSYWKEFGVEFRGTFDLDPESVSSRVFDKYVEKRMKRERAA